MKLASKLTVTASVAQSVSVGLEIQDSRVSLTAGGLQVVYFRNWSQLSLTMYIFKTLKFITPYFNIHILEGVASRSDYFDLPHHSLIFLNNVAC